MKSVVNGCQLRTACVPADKTLREVEQHAEWYGRLQELAGSRRRAVAEWRASRAADRQAPAAVPQVGRTAAVRTLQAR